MATAIQLEAKTVEMLDDIVAINGFSSREEAIRAGLRLVQERDEAYDAPLTPYQIERIKRGLADIAAGRGIPIEQVRADMERRFGERR